MRVVASPAGPAARSSPPACRSSSATDLTVIANTGDDIEALRRPRLPRPRPLHVLALPTRSTRSAAGGSATTPSRSSSGCGSSARRIWFGLADRDLATCLERAPPPRCRRAADDDALAELGSARSAPGRTVLPMCDEPVRDPGQDARRLARLPGVLHPRARAAGADRGRSSCAGIADGAATPEALAAIASAERDRDRPVEPGHLDRPDPRGARDARGDLAAPRLRSSRSARSSPARSSRGRPTTSCAAAAAEPSAAGVAALYGGLIDGMVVDAADPDADPAAPGSRPTLIDTLMADAGAPPAGRRRDARLRALSAVVRTPCARPRSFPSSASSAPRAGSTGSAARRTARRLRGDARRRPARPRASRGSVDRIVVVSGEPRAGRDRDASRRRPPRRPATTPGHSEAATARDRRCGRARRRVRRARSPATARCSTPSSSTASSTRRRPASP